MSENKSRQQLQFVRGFSAIAVGTLVVASALAGPVGQKGGSVQRQLSRAASIAMARDLGRDGGEGSVFTAAEEQYDNRAYPNTYIGYQQVVATRQAFDAVKRHHAAASASATAIKSSSTAAPAAAANTAAWQLIGPSTDLVSSLLSYTPGPGAGTVSSGRVTSIAVDPNCGAAGCRVWVGAAGGGIWETDDGLAASPIWRSSSGGLPSNAIGSIVIDPNDPLGNTLYAGTGEPNGSADSEAGLGLFKSTNGGASWTVVAGSVAVSANRAIGAILVDPANASHLYIGTDVARHGSSSVNGGRFTPPEAPSLGVYESVDGGATWAHDLNLKQDVVNPGSATGSDFFRGGVPVMAFDPNDRTTVYAATYGYGIWRSAPDLEGGDASFKQILPPNNPNDSTGERSAMAVANNAGHARVYVAQGGDNPGILFRVDNADVPAATLVASKGQPGGWVQLSSATPGDPGFASYNFCGGQCWYDNPIASPPGRPDTLWIGGSMQYRELNPNSPSNGRAVQRSTDAGASFTDMTDDAQSTPNWLHPDQHAIAFDPANPDIAFIGNDGGVFRTSGQFTDSSSTCASRGVIGADLTDCQQWLSAIPTRLSSLNAGLATLQFQSVSLNPGNPTGDVLGGTQDNGTLAFTGSPTWFESINGDGGQSGTDVTNPNIRVHTYFAPQVDVNFHGTQTTGWDWVADPLLNSGEAASFYIPLITDPNQHGRIFAGLERVWRTSDDGGPQNYLDSNCNQFTGTFNEGDICGDWKPLGMQPLTGTFYGTDKLGGYVVAIARATDTNTMWVATRRGRLFISTNANGPSVPTVIFSRIDNTTTPRRFISGIAVDPANPFHAFVSFSGYNAYTPATRGHVFEVTFNPATGAATWADRSNDLGDQPITGIALDSARGDLYASTDFGVVELPSGGASWVTAGSELPPVAVYGLTINSAARVLYAATHGRSAFSLTLP